ncbi:MAG: 5-(carboxyamino)imidazole ribonucleotide mutase [Candidatus Omnitrophica bacterium]|nr:5-(carboxyamino)imidazole ribonucleotide mutase [Candidatus Omnitrophota bacterium]
MTAGKVAILMGSDSDLEIMKEAADVLNEFQVDCDIQVLSAHRSPELVSEFASKARDNGYRVIICGAGGAAHLAGVVAAHTTLPVIGVPMNSTPLGGFDSLLATVQMPAGIPVATVAVGKPGARNAGILAVQMLALADAGLAKKLSEFKSKLTESVREKNKKLQAQVKSR